MSFSSIVQALRGKAETIRAGELDKALSKVGDGLTKKQLKAIEELSRSIVNKILHGPMTALRCDGADPNAVSQTLANMRPSSACSSSRALRPLPANDDKEPDVDGANVYRRPLGIATKVRPRFVGLQCLKTSGCLCPCNGLASLRSMDNILRQLNQL